MQGIAFHLLKIYICGIIRFQKGGKIYERGYRIHFKCESFIDRDGRGSLWWNNYQRTYSSLGSYIKKRTNERRSHREFAKKYIRI